MDQIKSDLKLEHVYINALDNKAIPIVRVRDIGEFVKLIRLFQPKAILVTYNSQKRKTIDFCVFDGGFAYVMSAYGYHRIEDPLEAAEKGFQGSEEFYRAVSQEFSDVDEYRLSSKLGYRASEDFKKSEELGFRGCIGSFRELFKQTEFPLRLVNFMLEAQIFHFAMENGFMNFDELHRAIENGFFEGSEYRDATAKGFLSHRHYQNARGLEIDSNELYERYCRLESIRSSNLLKSVQEALLYQMLDDMTHEEAVSVSDLWAKLLQAESILSVNENTLWYTHSFDNQDDFTRFLVSSSVTGRLGTSFLKKDLFQRVVLKSVSTATIAVDASNVAYGSGSSEDGDKPLVSNLEALLENLRGRGFQNLKVIADASLKYQIDDPDRYSELKKEYKILEAPGGTDADGFLIKYVIENQCYVISNDRFKDWKEEDGWVKGNIDRFLIRFMIIDDQVHFYDQI